MRDEALPNDSGATQSTWMQVPVPLYDAELPDELRVDVCVVGAGIAGLSTAYHLALEGLAVAVIDDGPVGGGETARTTAHLACALDDHFHWLERMHGAEGARLAAASHAAAIADIEAIVERHRIDCDFQRVDGYLFNPPDGGIDLDQELRAAHAAGLTTANKLPRAPLIGFDTGPCLRFPEQAQLHPIRYLRGLAAAFVELGGSIYCGVRADRVEGGRPARVHTDGKKTLFAGSVVIATNPPINSRVAIPLRQAAYRSYVIAVRIAAGSVARALYWDTADPYHYVRVAPGVGADEELLIVGGEDHRTGQDDHGELRWERLETWTRERFAAAGAVVARWSGQIMEPADGLAFIGRSPDGERGVFIVTGDSGNGMTHGALAGALLTDLVLGRANPWASLYDPRRTSLRALGELLRENANVAVQYAHWLRAGDVPTVNEVLPGQGAVMRRGLRMVAVYRDEAGACHERSAVCTHLGGVVAWNSAEKSWDCPCHGSRFDPLGRVIDGPAVHDLQVIEPEVGAGAPAPVETPAPPEVETRPGNTGNGRRPVR